MLHEPLSTERLAEIIATHVPKTVQTAEELSTWHQVHEPGPFTFCAACQDADLDAVAPEWPCELLRLAEEVQERRR